MVTATIEQATGAGGAGADTPIEPVRRGGDRLLAIVVGSIPLTGLVLPGSFLVFDALALLAFSWHWRTTRLGRAHAPAWLFAGAVLVLVAVHQLRPDMPPSSGLIFGRGAVTCVLVSLTLAASVSRGLDSDRVLSWYIWGTALTVGWALAAEILPMLDDLPGIRGDRGLSGRSIGLSRHANLLGLHVAVAGIYLHGLAIGRTRKVALGMILLVGLALAGSRAGILYLGLGLAVLTLLARSGRERRRAVLTGVASAGVTSTLLFATDQGRFLYDRLTGARGVTGDDERRELLELGVDLAREHWLLGAPYEGRLFHSFYLTYLAVLGVGGLIAASTVIAWSARFVWTRQRSKRRAAALASIVSMAVVLGVHNAVAEPVVWLVLLVPVLLPRAGPPDRLAP